MKGTVDLPLKLFKRGKVRDVFQTGDRLLIVSTDRISAFDFVLPSLIPGKGEVLNRLSAFWFEYTRDMVSNHLVSATPWKQPEFSSFSSAIAGRAILARKLTPFPIEAIVRGYIVGSGWKSYRESGEICGIRVPSGMNFGDPLPQPLFTPTTKAEEGHDTNMTYAQVEGTIGGKNASRIRDLSIDLFRKASEFAKTRGIVIADTKFEFGRDEEGNIVLIDEIFTPDSSRFWKASEYKKAREKGETPPSYDKQFVRNFLLESDWDRQGPPPPLPGEVITETTRKYREIYSLLTGQKLEPPEG